MPRLLALTAIAIGSIAYTGTTTALAKSDKEAEIQHQLQRYNHADGFIKCIGKVARRTIYSSNPVVRFKWTGRLHQLIETRKDARDKLDKLRIPPKPSVDSCTEALLAREGGYNPHAVNPKSGAYGGPQALPGSKMASAGPDWKDNIWTQIKWMQKYMIDKYGSSCAALQHSYIHGWY